VNQLALGFVPKRVEAEESTRPEAPRQEGLNHGGGDDSNLVASAVNMPAACRRHSRRHQLMRLHVPRQNSFCEPQKHACRLCTRCGILMATAPPTFRARSMTAASDMHAAHARAVATRAQ
jgi:hypothetical protein